MLSTLQHYRTKSYLLHEYVLMPDHIHLLLTPLTSLERAVQFVKGGYSHRCKKELQSNMEIWQRGYSDHRIRNAEDYQQHREYLLMNPVRAGLCECADDFEYSSCIRREGLDEVPQRLKPQAIEGGVGTAEAVPFQSNAEAVPFQSGDAVFLQSDLMEEIE